MAETNPPLSTSSEGDSREPSASKPAETKKRRRRRWPYVIGGVVVLLLLLVVLAPTLASTGAGRGMILRIVNGNLNGKLEVADWSIGWNSGISADGVRLLDESGKTILQASKLRTQLSLWRTIRSGFNEYALGRTDIDNLDLTNLEVDRDGVLNVAKVPKPSHKKPSSEPTRVSGEIHINNLTGNIAAQELKQKLHINPSQVAVGLKGLNEPISNDIQLALIVEDPSNPGGAGRQGGPGAISIVGNAALFDHDKFDLTTAKVKERLMLSNVNLTALNPFLAIAGLKLQTGGVANGALDVNLAGQAGADVIGEIKIAAFTATGDLLKGDRFASDLTIPVKISRVMSGKDAGKFKIDDLRIQTSYGQIGATADVSPDALQRLAKRTPPGSEGHFSLVADFNQAARLMNDMPRTFKLAEGLHVDSGRLYARIEGWIKTDSVVAKAQLNVQDVAGSSRTGKVKLDPVTSTIDFTYLPLANTPFQITQLQDVGVVVNSAFAELNGGTGKGGNLTRFDLAGKGDLGKLQQQLEQFFNLEGLKLAGAWTLKAGTSGDPAHADAPVHTDLHFTATQVVVKSAGKFNLTQPWLDLSASGDLNLRQNSVESITKGVVALKSNNPAQPTVNLLAKGDLNLSGAGSSQFEFTLDAVLGKAREEFGAFLDALNYVESGDLAASGAAKYDGKALSFDKPVSVRATKLSLRQSSAPGAAVALRDQSVDASLVGVVNFADGGIGADVKSLSAVETDPKGKVLTATVTDAKLVLARAGAGDTKVYSSGIDMVRSAKVNIRADRLEVLQAIVDVFSSSSATPPVAVARTTNKSPERVTGNERISARLAAADATIDDAGEQKPLPALRILGGALVLDADVQRQGQTTSIKNQIGISNLKLSRGEGSYTSKDKPINIKLDANIESADATSAAVGKTSSAAAAIKKIEIKDLSGDLDVGVVKTTRPIVITNLASSPTIDGAIDMRGSLASLLGLVEAVQGAKPGSQYPYSGDYALVQQFTSQGDVSKMVGSLNAPNFKVHDPEHGGRVVFSEDRLVVNNDVSINTRTDTATIRDLSVNMQSTGALALALSNGELTDWTGQRKIVNQIEAKLRVDWPKFWTIVAPMLDEDTAKSLEDLQVAGVMDRTFKVSGSFPTSGFDKRGNRISLNTAQSLRFVNAYGGVNFERVSVNGIDVRNLELPVALEKGILYLQDASKPKGQRYPAPFACNGGMIDLGGIQIDLRHTGADGSIAPWITIPDANKVVLKDVALNPLLADSTIGNFVNPGFSGPDDARGRVTLTSAECRDVPIDWFTSSKRPGKVAVPRTRRERRASQSDGRAELRLAISEIQLQSRVLGMLLKTKQISGEVKNGKIIVENGVVKSDLPIELENKLGTLAWTGSVNLQERKIIEFNTAIPKQLLADLPILRSNDKYIPAVVNVPISGSFDAPKIDLVAAVTKSLLPGVGKPEDLLNKLPDLLNQKKDKDKDKSKPRGDEPIGKQPRSSADDRPDMKDISKAKSKDDPLGDLVDLAGGLLNKDKDKKKDKNDSRDKRNIGDDRISNPPPRRGDDK